MHRDIVVGSSVLYGGIEEECVVEYVFSNDSKVCTLRFASSPYTFYAYCSKIIIIK